MTDHCVIPFNNFFIFANNNAALEIFQKILETRIAFMHFVQ